MNKKVAAITDEVLASVAENCRKLVDSHQTLTLSTLSPEGEPEISCTPYLRADDGAFYIFVSELAHHTLNLQTNPVCSILFAAPEAQTNNIYGRERVCFRCLAHEIPRGTQHYEQTVDQMQKKFGNTIEVLRNLPDFRLFALKPTGGQYTAGFGKAFRINADGSFIHIALDKKNQ